MDVNERPAARRIAAIDSARGAVCYLAILGHLGTRQFPFIRDGDFAAGLPVFIRTATPTFMVLFGTMIALVYMRRLQAGPTEPVVKRLLVRGLTCYLVYVAITLAAFGTGKLSGGQALGAVLLANEGRFGEIFKVYAGLFLLIVLFLPWIRRYGSLAVLALAAGGWLLKYLLAELSAPHALHYLVGHDAGYGPSILPGLSLVAFGMAIGEALLGSRRSRWLALALAAGAVGMLVCGALDVGLRELLSTLAALRRVNHPYYFAFGILASGAGLLVFAGLQRSGRLAGVTGLLGAVGGRSLFFYGFGNVAINLLPVVKATPPAGLGLSLAFIAVLTLMTLDLARERSLLDRVCFGGLSAFHRWYDVTLTSLVGGVLRAVRGRRPAADAA